MNVLLVRNQKLLDRVVEGDSTDFVGLGVASFPNHDSAKVRVAEVGLDKRFYFRRRNKVIR